MRHRLPTHPGPSPDGKPSTDPFVPAVGAVSERAAAFVIALIA
jgi:hypothetical protein